MASICFYLHAHQPYRVKKSYSVFDIGQKISYFDQKLDQMYFERIAKKSYLPMNKLLLDLITKTKGKFKVNLSISGILLEQAEKYNPDVIKGFKALIDTGCVEIAAESYYHSLACLYSEKEFKKQVLLHRKKIKDLFNYKPQVFRNTELIYSNELGKLVKGMGYKAILAEGWDPILGWRSPNFLYKAKDVDLVLFLKNYRLSDDIAFRFSTHTWEKWPLTADEYTKWINQVNGNGEIINLFMDYETYGEHQWECTGIFEFLKVLPDKILKHPDNNFKTFSEIMDLYQPRDEIDFPYVVSWADTERDLSAWTGNEMQQFAIKRLYSLEKRIYNTKNKEILKDWQKLQISDHFYYMCTKWFADGDVHKYFNPYESPYDLFINYMNILTDLEQRIVKIENKKQQIKNKLKQKIC